MTGAILPWHLPMMERCGRMMESGRMPHAILMRGRRGDGLLQAAESLVSLALCSQPVGSSACGQCKSCQLVAAGSHPDAMILQPEKPSKVIKIDAVRALVKQFAHTAQIANWKVAVLYPANYLNTAAANALLKTLEEPPGQALLVLAVDQHARVMPTLQSRCQLIELNRPGHQKASDWLKTQGIQDAELLNATAGEPLRAQAWHEADTIKEWRGFRSLLVKLAEGQISLAQAAGAAEETPIIDKVYWYMEFLKELLEQSRSNRRVSQALFQCFDQAVEVVSELERGTNPNLQLLNESLLMQWQHIGANAMPAVQGAVRA